MDGDCALLQSLKQISDEFDAWLMVDDAHGMGVLPTNLEGMIVMGTLSKALGSYGGYVCGSQTLVSYLKTAARSLIFSTGLPPSALATSIAALDLIQTDHSRGEKALANARLFTSLAGLPPAQSAIVPLILKDNDEALKASSLLENSGFLVAAIRPPTVPANTARLRFAFSALHTAEQIKALADIINEQGWVCRLAE